MGRGRIGEPLEFNRSEVIQVAPFRQSKVEGGRDLEPPASATSVSLTCPFSSYFQSRMTAWRKGCHYVSGKLSLVDRHPNLSRTSMS